MRYRITLVKDAASTSTSYEAGDLQRLRGNRERGGGADNDGENLVSSETHQKIREEMRGQNAFRVIRIEEIPSD
jgi:hypothetical protein